MEGRKRGREEGGMEGGRRDEVSEGWRDGGSGGRE